MNYHIARDNQQLGVFSREEVLARYQRGEIRATDLAWAEGMADWKPVGEVFGAAPAATGAPPPVPTAGAPAAAAPVMTTVTRPVTPGAVLPPKPDNNLVWAILTTLFCCMPFGIVSIVYASQVDSKYQAGDYEGAKKSARLAGLWAIWAAVGLAIVGIGYVIVVAVFVGLGAAGSGY